MHRDVCIHSVIQSLAVAIIDYPAMMKNTGVDITSSIFEWQASGYLHKLLATTENTFVDISQFLGSGCIYSTMEDLFLLDETLHTGQLLADNSMDSMINAGYLGEPIPGFIQHGRLSQLLQGRVG